MKTKVGVVDDAPFIREIIRRLVEKQADCEVVFEAEDGVQAVEMAKIHKPDVIFMDIIMPNMSGIEATKIILESQPDTRVIACSTNDQQSVVMQALEAGCSDYIHKPFTKEQLIKAIGGPS